MVITIPNKLHFLRIIKQGKHCITVIIENTRRIYFDISLCTQMEDIQLPDPFEVTCDSNELPNLLGDCPEQNVSPKAIIPKENQPRNGPRKKKIDRTYTKRRRSSNKIIPHTGFRKDDIAWAIWIERDGSEIKKVKTRPIAENDLKRTEADFKDAHEVISAFLMVVTADTKKGYNKTSVARIDNQINNLDPMCSLNGIRRDPTYYENRGYTQLQNVYLYRYFLYDPKEIQAVVYTSIARLMLRVDYQRYYEGLLNQSKRVEEFLSIREQGISNKMCTAIEYLTNPVKENSRNDVQYPHISSTTLTAKFKR